MAHVLNVKSRLALVASEAQMPNLDDEDEEVDVVVANSKMNIVDLLEDEIILALPLAPKHDFECAYLKEADDDTSAARRPFSNLGKRR